MGNAENVAMVRLHWRLSCATFAFAALAVAVSTPASAEPFNQSNCVTYLTVEMDRPLRITRARAEARCAAIASRIDSLRSRVLGSWRNINREGLPAATLTFSADGTVTRTRAGAGRRGRQRPVSMTSTYEIINPSYKIGEEQVVVLNDSASFGSISFSGNTMTTSWKPAIEIIEEEWVKMPQNR